MGQGAHQAGGYPRATRSMSTPPGWNASPLQCYLGIKFAGIHQVERGTRSMSTPPGWNASPLQCYLDIKFAGIHQVERGTRSAKCSAQKHNKVSLARALNQIP